MNLTYLFFGFPENSAILFVGLNVACLATIVLFMTPQAVRFVLIIVGLWDYVVFSCNLLDFSYLFLREKKCCLVFFLLIQLNLLGWAHSSKWNRFLKKISFENYFPSAWKSGSVWYKAIMKAKILRQQTCVHDLWFDSCMLKLFEKVKCKVSTKLFFTSHINEMVGESHLLLFQELRNCRFKGKMKLNVNSWVEIFYLQKKTVQI